MTTICCKETYDKVKMSKDRFLADRTATQYDRLLA